MVHKAFWDNPYQTQLVTYVTAVAGADVTLKETIFYAFSGGQESDRGTVGQHTVLAARKESHEIIYTLPPEHGLDPGDRVTVQIDWERRYKLMRLHFAAELVLKIITRTLPGIKKIGAHISEDKARIDFSWPETIAPRLPEIQQETHTLVAADHPITSDFSDKTSEQRFWRIEGFAQVPCGGTHVKRTGEVGKLRLKRKNVGKDKERVEISLQDPTLP